MIFSVIKFKTIAKFLALFAFFAMVFTVGGTARAVQSLGDSAGANTHPHNLSSLNTSASGIHAPVGTETRICVFCHTPHSASSKGALWNRRDPIGPNGDGTFPLYGAISGRLDEIEIDNIAEAQYGTGEYPNGASRLCLSCHDGVTAIGEVINPGSAPSPLGGLGSILAEDPGSNAVIDLDASHPVSFIYTESVRSQIQTVKGDAVPGDEYILPSAGILDSQQRMQCTACHDPHIDTNDGTYLLPMWRKYTGDENADYESTCGECHVGGSSSPGLIRGGNDAHNI